jgi:hypothetical protein
LGDHLTLTVILLKIQIDRRTQIKGEQAGDVKASALAVKGEGNKCLSLSDPIPETEDDSPSDSGLE